MNGFRTFKCLVSAMLVAICVLAGVPLYSADNPVTIGMVMDEASPKDREPLRAYLTTAMGRPVNLEAPDSYRQTVAHLADGSYDFACLGALMYVRAHAKYGVIPLVRRTADLHYRSVFITGAGSSIYSLSDLKRKQFAFGDIDSTSAHLIPYYELMQAGINPNTDFKFRYSGSHLVTAALVENGVVDAGAIDETFFNFLIASGKINRNKVRVFYTSKPYVDYVWVARKDVPLAQQERFARALLALAESTDHPVLQTLRAEQFVPAKDQEYTLMRQIAHELKMF